jgi:hypothetical protein
MLTFTIAIGSGLFLCGLSVACCVVRHYKKQKEALLKNILDPDQFPLEGLEGYALDRRGNLVGKGSIGKG